MGFMMFESPSPHARQFCAGHLPTAVHVNPGIVHDAEALVETVSAIGNMKVSPL